ncbi:MAG: tetratricopeptide repeat protein [Candidatus Tantalella remota]|nr:tetratricopeptide repeat protein [Candidatus Tantalella remota]
MNILHKRSTQIFLIIFFCAIVYIPSLNNGFIWDDDQYVHKNPWVQRADGLKDIWLTHKTPQYYPLVFTSFWVENKLWGNSPFGYHLVNLLLHIFNALLLFGLIRRIYPRAAFPVAILFAIHPIQVETVAWVSERKNLLGFFFFLLTAVTYLKYTATKKAEQFYLSVAFFICALLSKSVAVCFVSVPLLYEWWKNKRVGLKVVRDTIPFAAVGLAGAINTIYLELYRVGAQGTSWSFLAVERVVLAGRILCFYVYKLLVPLNFVFIYPRWEINIFQWWQWLFPAAVLCVFLALIRYRGRIGRGALAVSIFYVISIFPALGFVNVFPMKFSFVADHFSYFSVAALLLMLSAMAFFISDKLRERIPGPLKGKYDTAKWVFFLVLVVALSCKSYVVTRNYINEETLWKDVLENNPEAFIAYNNLGTIYRDKREYDKALTMFQKAVELSPDDTFHYSNLGSVYGLMEKPAKAVPLFKKAIELHPDRIGAYNNLGIAYLSLGEYDEAIGISEKTLELWPANGASYDNLAVAYYHKKDYPKAVQNCERAVALGYEMNPELLKVLEPYRGATQPIVVVKKTIPEQTFYGDVLSLNQKGVEKGKSGDLDGAILLFKQALQLDPSDAETYNNLGFAYYQKGEVSEAKAYFEKALSVDPGNLKAKTNLDFLRNKHPEI